MNNNLKTFDKKLVYNIDTILSHNKIIPILVEDKIENALNTVEALLKGGITIVEVTLRTPKAFKISEAT